MADNNDRRYELTIINADGRTRTIRDLMAKFMVKKSIITYPNLLEMEITNVAPATFAALRERSTRVTLNAGYAGNVRLLFTGDVRNVFQSSSPLENKVKFFAGDGQRDWENARFNRTFSQSVTASQAVTEVLKSFTNTTVGSVAGIPDVADNLRGQTLSGPSAGILDRYAKEYGFTWSIQDGEIVILPDDEPLEGDDAIVINAGTGMINSPTVTVIGADVTTQMNTSLLPNRAIKIEALGNDIRFGNLFFKSVPRTRATGLYKVQQVTFRGNSRGGEWSSTVVGKSLDV